MLTLSIYADIRGPQLPGELPNCCRKATFSPIFGPFGNRS